MEETIIHRPANNFVEAWKRADSYTRMRLQQTFEIQTPYGKEWDGFAKHLGHVVRIIGGERLSGKQALIVGPGRTAEEAILIAGTLPGLGKIHLVEWSDEAPETRKIPCYELAEHLAQVEASQEEYRKIGICGKVEIHQADAVNMAGIDNDSIHLVYMRDVIEHIEGYEGAVYPKGLPQKVLDIFREIKRVLVVGGHLLTMGTMPTLELDRYLNGVHARTPGLKNGNLGFVRVQDDLWQKAA